MKNRHLLSPAAASALFAGCATQPAHVCVADTPAQTPSLSNLHGLVVTADVKASNGVVHIVDRVLPPPGKEQALPSIF